MAVTNPTGKIETYRGKVPNCCNCNKPLRPNYETEQESHFNGGVYSGRRKVYLEDDPSMYNIIPVTDEPEHGHAMKDPRWGTVYWDAKKKRVYRFENYGKVLSRKFLGTFGAEGSNYFCSVRCGFLWACRRLRQGRP